MPKTTRVKDLFCRFIAAELGKSAKLLFLATFLATSSQTIERQGNIMPSPVGAGFLTT
jgi:hypothetical protein